MSLKKLVLIKMVIFFGLVIIGFKFEVPVAYVPVGASSFEFIVYHLAFMVAETLILTAMFLHMLQAADIDLDSDGLKQLFH